MTEEEHAAAERRVIERSKMMQGLLRSFGEVVDAVVAGELPARVSAEFANAELKGLAKSGNTLLETIDRQIGETEQMSGTVLANAARAKDASVSPRR